MTLSYRESAIDTVRQVLEAVVLPRAVRVVRLPHEIRDVRRDLLVRCEMQFQATAHLLDGGGPRLEAGERRVPRHDLDEREYFGRMLLQCGKATA